LIILLGYFVKSGVGISRENESFPFFTVNLVEAGQMPFTKNVVIDRGTVDNQDHSFFIYLFDLIEGYRMSFHHLGVRLGSKYRRHCGQWPFWNLFWNSFPSRIRKVIGTNTQEKKQLFKYGRSFAAVSYDINNFMGCGFGGVFWLHSNAKPRSFYSPQSLIGNLDTLVSNISLARNEPQANYSYYDRDNPTKDIDPIGELIRPKKNQNFRFRSWVFCYQFFLDWRLARLHHCAI